MSQCFWEMEMREGRSCCGEKDCGAGGWLFAYDKGERDV